MNTNPALSMLGMPLAATGQNAVVFLLRNAEGESFALRCFTTPAPDGRARYFALADHLSSLDDDGSLAKATWIDDGIVVGDRVWPVVLMPWVEGRPLNLAVEDILDREPDKLLQLATNLTEVVCHLQESGIAHGDLQHGNILVAEDLSVTLVDLDGVWVANTECPPPNELGHPNYQHPERSERHWSAYVDSFSGFLIDTSLRALAADPSLREFMYGENLVVTRNDLVNLSSPVWSRLNESPDQSVLTAVADLKSMLGQPVDHTLVPLVGLAGRVTTAAQPDMLPSTSNLAPPPPSPLTAGGEWWENPSTPRSLVDATSTMSGESTDLDQTIVGRRPTLTLRASVKIHQTAIGSGAIAGAIAGLLGCWFFSGIESSIDTTYRMGAFVAIVSGLIGGLILGWEGLITAQFRKAVYWIPIGIIAAASSAIWALSLADAMITNSLHGTAGVITDAPVLPLAFGWMLVAMAVGFVLGLMQNIRTAMLGLIAGGSAGFLGGLIHASNAAHVNGTRLLVEPSSGATIASTVLVATMIGVAVGFARRTGALGTLRVIEGKQSGLEVLIKPTTLIGSSPLGNTLKLNGPGVFAKHAVLTIAGGTCTLTAHGPIQINGRSILSGTQMRVEAGDILCIGESYVKVALRDTADVHV